MLGGLLVVAVVSTRWVRLHRSPRRPPGLSRLTALRAPRTRGMGVVLPVPACVRPWQAAWVPRRTPIAGVAGDGVCQTDHTRYVKGADCGVVSPTAHGQALPPLPEGGLVVPEEPAVAQQYAVLALHGHAARACETPVGLGGQAHGTARRRQRVPGMGWPSPRGRAASRVLWGEEDNQLTQGHHTLFIRTTRLPAPLATR